MGNPKAKFFEKGDMRAAARIRENFLQKKVLPKKT
jgi:hypothetical protein